MNKTLRIAKIEISILFYSPVAWLVLVIFMIQTGMGFFGMLGGFKEMFLMGEKINNLTFSLFPGMNGLFDKVLQTLYLYIPLLTMGLMSRETSSGSIKLLLSSPVKIREIVLGKFLAMVFYSFLLLLILVIYSGVGIALINFPDIKLICSGLLALFLLTCTYSAIGLYMSSLTSYQVVAAISTLAAFALLRYVGNLGQDIDFVRDLTYFLSISGRTEDMLKGLVSSRDVLYYLLIIILFLGLTMLLLRGKRSSRHWSIRVGQYSILLAGILTIGYISARPGFIGYLDMTAGQSRTLTAESQAVAKQIKDPLTITTYVNLLDQHVYTGLPAARNTDLARFEEYRRFIPELKMDYVYYYDAADMNNNRNMIYQGDITGLSTKQVAERVADNFGLNLDMFLTPVQIRSKINLLDEENAFTRILSYQGRSARLRIYNDSKQFPEEAEITSAIKTLLHPAPVIAFANGNEERSISVTGDRNYERISSNRKFRKALINQGFDVISLNLNQQEIQRHVSILVLGDPGQPFSDTAMSHILQYINNGGNMLITAEPEHSGNINPVLKKLGIEMLPGMLTNGDEGHSPDLIQTTPYAGSKTGYNKQTGSDSTTAPATYFPALRRGFVNMPTAGTLKILETGEYQADTLLVSNSNTWNKTAGFATSATTVSFNPAKGEEKNIYPTAIALQRNTGARQQKIMICSDADFMSNIAVDQARDYNLAFIYGIFRWFTNGDYPVTLHRPVPADDALTADKRAISRYRLLVMWGIPALLVAAGGILLTIRKRK